eukprot:scaffold22728_cov48-Cyclotella_meneghiniana.AAC.2
MEDERREDMNPTDLEILLLFFATRSANVAWRGVVAGAATAHAALPPDSRLPASSIINYTATFSLQSSTWWCPITGKMKIPLTLSKKATPSRHPPITGQQPTHTLEQVLHFNGDIDKRDIDKKLPLDVAAAVTAVVANDHEETKPEDNDIEIPVAPSSSLPTATASVSNLIEKNDSQQRLNEIKSGLQRLGVTLPDEQNEPIIKPEMSSDDLVRLIMQQASDEVLLEGNSDHLVKSIMQQASDEILLEENSDRRDSHYNDSLIDENDSMFEGYQDEPDDDLDALMVKVDNIIASAEASSRSETNDAGDTQKDRFLDNQLRMIEHAQALLLQARLCFALEREDGDASSGVRHLSSDDSGIISIEGHRRKQARDKIERAVRSLQDGLAKWT